MESQPISLLKELLVFLCQKNRLEKLGVVAVEKGAFESPSTKVTNFTFLLLLSFPTIKNFIISVFQQTFHSI